VNICTPCPKKQNCFWSELRQISTKFDNFWYRDGQDDKIMQGALIFRLTQYVSMCQVENEWTSHNSILLSIFMPKIIKGWWKFDKVLTETILLSFFGTRCSWYYFVMSSMAMFVICLKCLFILWVSFFKLSALYRVFAWNKCSWLIDWFWLYVDRILSGGAPIIGQ